jgi:hypothetical protein
VRERQPQRQQQQHQQQQRRRPRSAVPSRRSARDGDPSVIGAAGGVGVDAITPIRPVGGPSFAHTPVTDGMLSGSLHTGTDVDGHTEEDDGGGVASRQRRLSKQVCVCACACVCECSHGVIRALVWLMRLVCAVRDGL